MATNRDLLKEAIADAKAVKEMAIANAKAALEEAFTPQLKTMLSAKLQEMEKEEMKEEELDEAGFEKMDSEEKGFDGQLGNINVNEEEDDMMEVDLEELLAELEEEEKVEETEINESEITEEEMEDESRAERADVDKYEYEKGKEAGEDEGEAQESNELGGGSLEQRTRDDLAELLYRSTQGKGWWGEMFTHQPPLSVNLQSRLKNGRSYRPADFGYNPKYINRYCIDKKIFKQKIVKLNKKQS